jgi:hypothetical protein
MRSLVPALGFKMPAFFRLRAQGAATAARPSFTPINPWLGLTGAALGVVMGGALYTRFMTPAPSRAGKASASAPVQSESVSPSFAHAPEGTLRPASPVAPSSGVSLLVDPAPFSLLLAPPLPSGKEAPFSLATSAGLSDGNGSADEPADTTMFAGAPEAVLQPVANAEKRAQLSLGRKRTLDRASEETAGPLGRTSEESNGALGRASQPPAEAAATSPVAHTHRSGPLKLEDL